MTGLLGCSGTYAIDVHKQGARGLFAQLDGLQSIKWGRKLDAYSEATVVVAKKTAGAACCRALGNVHTWGHEVTVYRDDQLVWQGPITTKTETRTTVQLDCRDMLSWLDHRNIQPPHNTVTGLNEYFFPTPGSDTALILARVIADAFPLTDALRNPGLTEYLVCPASGTASTTDHLWADSATVATVVNDLIQAGLDMYTVGRAIHFATTVSLAELPAVRLTQDDFLTELSVVEDGLDAGTRAVLVGGQPVDALGNPITNTANDVAPVIGASGPVAGQPFWGQLDTLSSSPNTTDPTVAAGIARAIRASQFPPPLDIVVPDGATLSPTAPVTVQQLTPGRPVLVALTDYCTPVSQVFKVNELDVTWTSDQAAPEAVQVSLVGTNAALPPGVTSQSAAT
jgi:hypothetical protein